jgi:hypothetical protein
MRVTPALGSKMNMDQTLLNEFEKLAKTLLTDKDAILRRDKSKITFQISKQDTHGFDIGATVEAYGIYPEAGAWHGAPWEPMKDWTMERVCKDYFGFVRMLLSHDAQLRYEYRHGKLRKAGIYLRDKNGWRLFEEVGFFVLPFGNKKEEVYQNNRMTSRYPYENIASNSWGIYYW